MNSIESALSSALSKYPNMPLVIAYSGGVDSQVLLHAFASLKQNSPSLNNAITVCHVNHGLSENAYAWQEFAEQACAKLQLPLTVCQVNVKAQAQNSLEALARDARYQALQSIYQESSLILTGHHSDDQAETFLLALKRGSGLKGLSAMATYHQQDKDILVRPLLNISRDQITAYANDHQLRWVEDESNTDTRFDRNFIRNDIMPRLTKRWPSIAATIKRSSEHCQEGQVLLDELALEDLKHCQISSRILKLTALTELSRARFNNLIRYFLAQQHCLMPSTEQLNQLAQQLNANEDKNPAVKVGDHYLRRYQEGLYLTSTIKDVSHWSSRVELCNPDVSKITLPDNLGVLSFVITDVNHLEPKLSNNEFFVLAPTSTQQVTIRFNHNNPTCLPDYRKRSRDLKKVLQELNIPPWQRKSIPFLYYDDVLVAALGFFVCQPFVLNKSLAKKAESEIMPSILKITWHEKT